MRFLGPFIRWTFLLAVLAAISTITFQLVRYRPRFTLHTSDIDMVHLSPDGRYLLQESNVWDTRRGCLVHELFGEHGIARWQTAVRGSLLATVIGEGELWLVDWIDKSYWPLAGPDAPGKVRFSDSGRLVLVRTADEQPKTFVFDVATKKRKTAAPGMCTHVSSDDRLLFLRKWPSRDLSVVDVETGNTLGELPVTTQDVTYAANGRRLVAGLPAAFGPLDDRVTPRLCIYELTAQGFKETPLELNQDPGRSRIFTPDGNVLITWFPQGNTTLDFIDAASGKTFASHAVEHRSTGTLSPDGLLFCISDWNSTATVFDVRTGNALWSRSDIGECRFLNADKLAAYRPFILAFLDSRTGAEVYELPDAVHPRLAIHRFGWEELPRVTPSGRHFHLRARQVGNHWPLLNKWLDKWLPQIFGDRRDARVVAETATGRELFRLVNHGENNVWLADNASTLVTADGNWRDGFVLRVWDVHPHRAYAWAVGSAAAAWLAGWTLKRLWTQVRNRPARAAERFQPGAVTNPQN